MFKKLMDKYNLKQRLPFFSVYVNKQYGNSYISNDVLFQRPGLPQQLIDKTTLDEASESLPLYYHPVICFKYTGHKNAVFAELVIRAKSLTLLAKTVCVTQGVPNKPVVDGHTSVLYQTPIQDFHKLYKVDTDINAYVIELVDGTGYCITFERDGQCLELVLERDDDYKAYIPGAELLFTNILGDAVAVSISNTQVMVADAALSHW